MILQFLSDVFFKDRIRRHAYTNKREEPYLYFLGSRSGSTHSLHKLVLNQLLYILYFRSFEVADNHDLGE